MPLGRRQLVEAIAATPRVYDAREDVPASACAGGTMEQDRTPLHHISAINADQPWRSLQYASDGDQ